MNFKHFMIGPRLAAIFAVLIALILGGNGLLLWQFHIARQETDRLTAVSQQVISVLRLQQGLLSFHRRLDELAETRDARRLESESDTLREGLLTQTQQTRTTISKFPAEIWVDPAFLPTLDAIEITLPSQLESITGLARSGDWTAVRLRLADELKPLETQTAALIRNIDQEVSGQLSSSVTRMSKVQGRIFLIVPATAVATFMIATFLGWAITRRMVVLRLEERIGERTRIARELHDTLLQGIISASMQLHVAIDRLPEDSPAKPLLGRVLELTGQVIDEGRNAVRGFRSPDKETQDLEGAFSRVPLELNLKTQAEFRVVVEGQQRQIHPVIRDEVYSIGREALVNAFRHSGAGRVKVELEYAAKYLRVMVRDDGCGIDCHVQESGRDGHWGLSGMRERAQKIGAKLKVLSRTGAGTEVDLRVPGDIAFVSRSSLTPRWLGSLYQRFVASAVPAHDRRVG